jgi:CheY-like chemotaxis protein
MSLMPLNILLADDDTDDCSFFDRALKEIPVVTHLNIVHDGEQLMDYLIKNSASLPDVLFLDISMPRKTGFECLSEIKDDKKLKNLLVVMFSTSFPQDKNYEKNMIDMLIKIGAHDYIRKSGDFAQLKLIIHNSLITVAENKLHGQQERSLLSIAAKSKISINQSTNKNL